MSIEAQIAQENASLVQELEEAAALADEITSLIQKAQTVSSRIESGALSLYRTAEEQLGSFVTQLEKQGQIVETASDDLVSALAAYQSLAEQGQAQCQTDCAAAESDFIATSASVQTLTGRVVYARNSSYTMETQISADIGQVGADIQNEGAALMSEVGLVDGHVQLLESEFDSFLADVAQRLANTDSAILSEINAQLGGELGNSVHTFEAAIVQLNNEQAQAAIFQIANDAVQEIETTLTGIIDTAIEGLETTLINALRKMMDGEGRTDAENKLLDEAMEWLKPIYEPFIQQVKTAHWISGAVREFI